MSDSSIRFRLVGGDPALDLVNTIDWTPAGAVNELVPDYTSLTRWAEEVGVVSPRAAQRLRGLARAHPRRAAAALDGARALRTVLQRLFSEVAAGAPSTTAFAEFDRFVASTYARLTIQAAPPADRHAGRAGVWAWRDEDDEMGAISRPVVRSAAELLVSSEAGRIRVCGGAACGWMYVDRSRNHLRRWCQMETCGTREKSRRRRTGSSRRNP